jgi:hypothetical protein
MKCRQGKTRGFPNRDERYGVIYENLVAPIFSYTVSVEPRIAKQLRF